MAQYSLLFIPYYKMNNMAYYSYNNNQTGIVHKESQPDISEFHTEILEWAFGEIRPQHRNDRKKDID